MKIYTAKKMVLSIFTALVVGGTVKASAATLNDAEINIETNTVTISGNVEKFGKDTLLIVLNPGAEFNDNLDKEELQHQRYITVDENGDFTYSFKLKLDGVNDSGDYNYYIGGKNISEILQNKFYFASKEDAMKVVEEIEGALEGKTETEGVKAIKTVLDDEANAKKLAISSFTPFSEGDKSEIARIVYKIMSDENEIDNIKMQEIIKEASVVSAYNKGQSELVISADGDFLYDDVLEFSKLDEKYDIDLVKLYDEILSETGKEIVRKSILNNNYSSAEELGKAYATEILLKGLTNAEKKGFEHVKTLLSDKNVSFLGLTIKNKLTDDNLIEIAKQKEYKTVEELQNKIDSLKNTATKPQGGGGGGSAGGSTQGFINVKGEEKATVVPSGPNEIFTGFDDFQNVQWAEEAVNSLYEKGIVTGVSERLFEPDRAVTREEFIAMLVRGAGVEQKVTEINFTDVNESDWYYEVVKTAYSNGITKGMSDKVFGAGEYITRQDMAVMVSRVFDIQSAEIKAEFTDKNKISDYAKESIDRLCGAGIINGMGDGSFSPFGYTTRAQAAVVLYRILGK